MQFYENGFKAGDPRIAPADQSRAQLNGPLSATTDVLIVGCGPAGLTLAAQLAAFPDIDMRIVEQKDGPMSLGQADGIACRSMEMFNAFGFARRIEEEAYWVNEMTFWRPACEGLERHGRVQDVEDDLSEFPHVILNQARVHDYYLEFMRRSARRAEPNYGLKFVELEVDEAGHPDHPVLVRLENTTTGQIEEIRARYVVGCDGARSNVRRAIGRELVGDSANQAWGVMDVLATTDFPDYRLKAAIHSANGGNIIIIPREGGNLVRLYIALDKLEPGERVASRNITLDTLIAKGQRILQPYTLDVKDVVWWSVYEIGQRLCDKFDDVTADAQHPRVFIAGDACHTHSPKAGQGMNVSMQDAFNLGWKLAGVLRGELRPDLLHSYSGERQAIAKGLIDFDRELAIMMSAKPKSAENPDGIDPVDFQKYFVKAGRYTAGTATHYLPSRLTTTAEHQDLATGQVVGMRFHSAPVIRVADAKPMQLGHVHKADGRWRLYAFASKECPMQTESDIARAVGALYEDDASPLRRYTPAGRDVDHIFDLRVVFQQNHRDLDLNRLPHQLLPRLGTFGLTNYEKMFSLDPAHNIYDMRGIDAQKGCLIVVRPDQYIAAVLPLGDLDGLSRYFDDFMIPLRKG